MSRSLDSDVIVDIDGSDRNMPLGSVAEAKQKELLGTGQWIGLTHDVRDHAYWQARRRFELHSSIRGGTFDIASTSSYRLYLDGRMVGSGPRQLDQHQIPIDSYDFTPYLSAGTHAISILFQVEDVQKTSSSSLPSGFVARLECVTTDGEIHYLVTDHEWGVRSTHAWNGAGHHRHRYLGPSESLEAQLHDPAGEHDLEGDDPWSQCEPQALSSVKPPLPSFARSGQLHWINIWKNPTRIGRVGEALPTTPMYRFEFIPQSFLGVGYLYTNVYAPERLRGEIWIQSDSLIKCWLGGRLVLQSQDPWLGRAHHDKRGVLLEKGWNPILVKVILGQRPSSLCICVRGDNVDEWFFSGTRKTKDPLWQWIAPFAARTDDPSEALNLPCPPEKIITLQDRIRSEGRQRLAWYPILPEKIPSDHPEALLHAGIDREALSRAFSGLCRPWDDPPQVEVIEPWSARGVVLDFGESIHGSLSIAIEDARFGSVIDIAYTDILEDENGHPISHQDVSKGVLNPHRLGLRTADRIFCRDGAQVLETFGHRRFRYVMLRIETNGGALRLLSVRCRHRLHDQVLDGEFSCDDPELTAIWDTGASTLEESKEDVFVLNESLGGKLDIRSARIQALFHYAVSEDPLPALTMLKRLALDADSEGRISSPWPSEQRNRHRFENSLAWISALRDFHLFRGERGVIADMFPLVDRIVDSISSLTNENGSLPLLDPMEYDSSSSFASHTVRLISYFAALRCAHALGQTLGEDECVKKYAKLIENTLEHLRRDCFDPTKGLVVESGKRGIAQAPFLAQSLAVLHQIAPASYQRKLIEYLASEAGQRDAESPYESFMALWALERTAHHEDALRWIKTLWGRMLEFGSTTWWDRWNPKSPEGSGRAAGPTFLLSCYVLGVRPISGGFSQCLIRPRIKGLQWAEGQIPTPRGPIVASWARRKSPGLIELQVQLPPQTRAQIVFPVKSKDIWINGSKRLPDRVLEGKTTGDGLSSFWVESDLPLIFETR